MSATAETAPYFPIGGLSFNYASESDRWEPVRNFCHLSAGVFCEMQPGYRLYKLRYQGRLRLSDGQELDVAEAAARFEQAYAASRPAAAHATLLRESGAFEDWEGQQITCGHAYELLDCHTVEYHRLRGPFEGFCMLMDENARDGSPVNPVATAIWLQCYPPAEYSPYQFLHGRVLIFPEAMFS